MRASRAGPGHSLGPARLCLHHRELRVPGQVTVPLWLDNTQAPSDCCFYQVPFGFLQAGHLSL